MGWLAIFGLGAAAIAIGLEDESLLHTAGLSLLLGLGLGTARAFGFGRPRWLETLKWIGVTSAVLFGAFVLLVRTEVKADTWTSGLWWGLAVGVCLGLSQLFVLPRGCRYKLAWPIANGVAMAVVFSILGGNGDVIFSGPGPGILAMTGFGAASGAITGLALMVMREPSYRVFQAWRALRDFFLSTAPESDLALPHTIAGLVEAVRRGNVALANPLGSGLLENPALSSRAITAGLVCPIPVGWERKPAAPDLRCCRLQQTLVEVSSTLAVDAG